MQITVKELMSGDPVSIDSRASAFEAYETMRSHRVRHLPVIGGDGRVVGVLAADDLAAKLALPPRPQRQLAEAEARAAQGWRVREVMTRSPQTLGRNASISEAAERMADARIGCLPIVDEEGHLEGVLSETDLLQALATVATERTTLS
jgi:CBS domain-containing protein